MVLKKLLKLSVFSLMTLSIVLTAGCAKNTKGANQNGIDVERHNPRELSDSTFVFSEFHIGMTVPGNWKSEKSTEAMYVFKEDCSSNEVFCANLVARFIPLQQSLSLDECSELFLSSFTRKFKDFQLINSSDKEVRNFEIKIVDYKMFENNTDLGGTTAFIILGDKSTVFALSIMAKNDVNGSYVAYRRLFEQILNSIKPV